MRFIIAIFLLVGVANGQQQIIDIGTGPNDATGDSPREAFDKVNTNFFQLFDRSITNFLTVDELTDLPTLSTNVPNSAVYLTESGLEGWFHLQSITTTNRASVANSVDSAIGWVRPVGDYVYARHFCVSDGSTDDTVGLQAAIDLAIANNRAVVLPPGRTRVVPSSGKTSYKDTVSSIHERMVPSGMVLPDFTYEVAGSSGTISYRGTNYAIGQQIVGNFYHRGYARNTEIETITINGAGTGYSASDVLTLGLSGGTGTPGTLTVNSVGGSGEVTGVTLTTGGTYTTPSTTETAVTVTGGGGSGATFDITQQLHSSNDAALIPVFDVALWTTNNNFRIIGSRGISELYVDGPGVGIGILGTTPGTSPGDPTKIHIDGIDFIGNGSDASVGMFASHATFHGKFSFYAENIRIGVILNQCWNAHIEDASCNGLGKMDDFLQMWNYNQTTIDHMFTLNQKKGAIVDTSSAHGQSVGTLAYFNDNTTRMMSGTITEVVDSDTLLFQEIDDVANSIGVNEIVFDPLGSPSTNSMSWAKIHGGRGLVASNPDGLKVTGTWQNDTEIAIQLYADRGQGNFGPIIIQGHVEGPAQGLHAERAPFDPNSVMRAIDAKLRIFTGRPASGSFFGERHGIMFDNVRNSIIRNEYITIKQENVSTNIGIWIKDTCNHVGIEHMEFDSTILTNRVWNDQKGVNIYPLKKVMYDINPPSLDSRTISANTSTLTASVSRAGRVLTENDNDSFPYDPQYVTLVATMTPTAVGSSGDIKLRMMNLELNPNTWTYVLNENFNAVTVNEEYSVTFDWPVSDDGEIRFQWFVESGAGWTVDCEILQIGASF